MKITGHTNIHSSTVRWNDDILLNMGTDGDIALVLNSAGLCANAELTGVIVGTSVYSDDIPANSLIISNITNDGDLVFFGATGGNSIEAFRIDTSTNGDVLGGFSTTTWGLINESSSGTNPTLTPRRSDTNTGVGANTSDQVSLIGGAHEMLRLTENTALANYVGGLFDAADQVSLTSASGSTWRLIQTQAINVDWDGGTGVTALDGQTAYFDRITNTADQATTITAASTVYIVDAPLASCNITQVDSYALRVAAGDTLINGVLGVGVAGSLTIATGVVAVTKSYHTIVVECGAGAGADTLATATGGREGDMLILRPNTTGACDQVTVSDGTGANTFVLAGADFVMAHIDDRLTLLHNGTEWVELSRSDNS